MSSNIEYIGTKGLFQEAVKADPEISERTIRFYIAEGLISAPSAKSGTSKLFDVSHLYTLLVTRKLSREGLPLKAIKQLITGKDFSWLEKVAKERVKIFTSDKELHKYAQEFPLENEEVMVLSDPEVREAYLQSKLIKPIPEVWQRYQIAPGIELHLSNKLNKEEISELTEKCRQKLEQFLAERLIGG